MIEFSLKTTGMKPFIDLAQKTKKGVNRRDSLEAIWRGAVQPALRDVFKQNASKVHYEVFGEDLRLVFKFAVSARMKRAFMKALERRMDGWLRESLELFVDGYDKEELARTGRK